MIFNCLCLDVVDVETNFGIECSCQPENTIQIICDMFLTKRLILKCIFITAQRTVGNIAKGWLVNTTPVILRYFYVSIEVSVNIK